MAGHDGQPQGRRQSPIEITTANVVTSDELKPLDLSKGWTKPISGAFDNLGHTVTFRPKLTSATILQTHVGEYSLEQFHYHWGEGAGSGSEHFVDGRQYELEIHFVCKKVNNTNPDAGDALAVVGVFGEVDSNPNAEIKGVWKRVSPTQVVPSGSVQEVDGIVYSDLLPKSRDYFYYEGSLTTPGYDEVVQWFVLREPIQVPAVYLEQLRSIQNAKGNKILRNYRELQDLNGRVVKRLKLSSEGDSSGESSD